VEYLVILVHMFVIRSPARPAQPVPAPAPAPVAKKSAEEDEDPFIKLQKDLLSVMEKVKLCREMLQESPGIEHDEALADVIGFLEACRDRMVDVIEAGTNGLLGEDLFATCLKVNDSIQKTLDAERVSSFASI
jgi:hypothetical protein